jgi:hypothetical protein
MEVHVASRHILDAIRRRRSIYAFPPRLARQVRLLRWLPPAMSDWLIARMLGKLKRK